jgi:hypothetical protein
VDNDVGTFKVEFLRPSGLKQIALSRVLHHAEKIP